LAHEIEQSRHLTAPGPSQTVFVNPEIEGRSATITGAFLIGEEDRDLYAAGRRTPTRCDVLKADGFTLLLGPGDGSTRRWAARIVPILHAFLEESIARLALQSLLVRTELAGRHFLLCIDRKTRPRRQEHNQSGGQKRATRHAKPPCF
jgi:hypothetical protein